VPQIVTGAVGAVFGELLAESEVGGTMETRDEAVDNGFRHQIEAGDSGQHCRI
jgi:hypothetical protein